MLYFVSDFILVQAEFRYGKPFKYRSVIFFVIISILAVTSFQLFSYYMTN